MTSLPYIPDIDKWRKHFVNMAKGRTRPDQKGQYPVDRVQTGGDGSSGPRIQMVTPVAQAVELAKSELAMENERAPIVYKSKAPSKRKAHKKTTKQTLAKKTTKQTLAKKRKYDDAFAK
jgi:hypothetical protein